MTMALALLGSKVFDAFLDVAVSVLSPPFGETV
jgi:hypothetical protein